MVSREKLLVADDDVKFLKALTLRLEAEGYEVLATQDAYQALEFARRHQPDLLLLDINMPAGNGFSVQERIANYPELAETPVIYITGDSPGTQDEAVAEHGAFSIIHKPFRLQDLLATVRAALNRAGRPHAASG